MEIGNPQKLIQVCEYYKSQLKERSVRQFECIKSLLFDHSSNSVCTKLGRKMHKHACIAIIFLFESYTCMPMGKCMMIEPKYILIGKITVILSFTLTDILCSKPF